ncbi:MAG: signal recognition particle-docking protein FtsY [Acidimicrobiia bacterium]|nr:signal recognition particle-docking protein FtsY [Acidimicrobiia bacterium]
MEPLLLLLIVVVSAALLVAVTAVYLRSRGRDRPPTATAPAPTPSPTLDAGLRARLAKTRSLIGDRLGVLLGRSRFDSDFWDGLEEVLIAADVGVAASSEVVETVRAAGPSDAGEAVQGLQSALLGVFGERDRSLGRSHRPATYLVVGVNGTGKTTSIGKLASRLRGEGLDVVLGSADTFRAAADQQLKVWAERIGVDVVSGDPGADPASVAFEAYRVAKDRDADVVIVDTAGRLQSKTNLMDELEKVARVVKREAGELDEVLLVIDGTTGQNALAQARAFTEAVAVTGIVLTKLDGTAKGGVAIAIERELDIPVKLIGVGEGVEDLVPFDPKPFVDALVGAE